MFPPACGFRHSLLLADPFSALLAYRDSDDALSLTALAATMLADDRRGRNTRHHLLGLLRQAVYGRLAGYEDVNDADRLPRDPAMRALIGREAVDRPAAASGPMVLAARTPPLHGAHRAPAL